MTVECMSCGAPLGAEEIPPGVMFECPRCRVAQQADIFPAFYRKPEAGPAGQAVTLEGESSCFHHPQKKAVLACDGCGRFLCALCVVEFSGQRLCPSCIEAGQTRKKITTLETRRTLYDDIALTLALLPLLMWPITLVTAPAALYYAIRYWNAPRSILPRTRIRFVAAILLGLLQIAGWSFIGYALFTKS